MHASMNREREFSFRLADAGENDPLRRHARFQRALDLALAHRIGAGAFARERGQHGDVSVGFHREGDHHIARRERVLEDIVVTLKRRGRIDVSRRADSVSNRRERDILAAENSAAIFKVVHGVGCAPV